MRINELKIYGFKSFADRTSIKFEDDFVAIIGPNGSGKSNIIDAIRWVFGEQSSKSLRGGSSTDVIFGGTQKRKKMNFAEVALVLDNSDGYLPLDYSEIEIKRRLYKNGESSYALNRIDCRLRDITDLVMDSAMGKDSFSIISQGKIEEIITAKPENRRVVIEEVAGVLKYKKRKEVALKKLAKTDDNLSQVELIIEEMQERLKPLENQSSQAKKYLELKSSLESMEVSLLANKIGKNIVSLEGYEKFLESLEDELLLKNTQLINSDALLEELKQPVSEIKIEINQFNNRIRIENQKLSELKSEYLLILERTKSNTSDNLLKKSMEIKNKIQKVKEQLLIETKELDEVKIKTSEVTNKYEYTNQILAKYRKDRFSLNEKLKDNKELNNSSTLPFAVRQLKLNPDFKDLKTVKELFTTNQKYSEAIITCLGGRSNEVVCDDINQIKRAIRFLKDKKHGRVTFIPLKDVKKYQVDERFVQIIKEQDGFIDYAINLVKFEDRYLKAFENILATTIVVDTIENANQIAKVIKNRYRIVTLSGDIIATGGTITGGFTKAINQISVVNDIAVLEEKIRKLNSSYEQVLKEKEKIDDEYANTVVEHKIVEQKVDATKNSLQNLAFELESNTAEDSTIDLSIEVEISNLQKSVDDTSKQVIELEQKLKKLEITKDDNIVISRNCSSDINKLTVEKSKVEVSLSKVRNEIEIDTDILSQEYELSYQLAYERCEHNIDLELYSQEVLRLKREIRVLGIVNLDAIEEYDTLQARYSFIFEQKNDLNLAKEKLLGVIEKLDNTVVSRFELVYNKLRSEFKMIFSELFAGGQADLVLTNPEDLLYTGVEIVAQPPGKKLQTISLLSGGEKALTAISLLFAILRIRTVPFAILDEVEAALDDANVQRYAKYLKVFSTQTQFLVITHRQGTMEIVDTLYGITMAEKGVSSVVKIKMNEIGENDV